MKPVYKCDYCSFMDVEEKVREHEPKCHHNYDRKSCHTCKHKRFVKNTGGGNIVYECKKDIDIPNGMIYEFCNYYEMREQSIFDFIDNIVCN